MPTLTKPNGEVHALLAAAIERYRPDLLAAEVTIGLLAAWPRTENDDHPLKLHGYPCAATIKVNSYKLRCQGLEDVTLTLDGPNWERLDAAEQDGLLDHELTHLELCYSKSTKRNPVCILLTDDAGRPKLKNRLHDYEIGGFVAVMDRHGLAAPETQLVRQAVETYGQLRLTFDGEANS
jgi:hypothetical protein